MLTVPCVHAQITVKRYADAQPALASESKKDIQDGYTLEQLDVYGLENGVEKVVVHNVSEHSDLQWHGYLGG